MNIRNLPKDLWTFAGFLLAGSVLFYGLIIAFGGLENFQIGVLGLMWVPGLSAIATVLIHRRGLKSLGWRLGNPRYLLIGYLLPLVYAAIPYGIVWLTRLGAINTENQPSLIGWVFFATVGVLSSLVTALGEEIGWRGYLVPRLTEFISFRKTTLIVGGIWLLWHTPLILFADYRNPDTPIWYSWICFAFLVMGINFAFSWLRMRSGSLWPSALMHASHNLFIQTIFDAMTVNTGITAYLTGEFGAGLAIMGLVVGIFFYWLGKD
jgi:membrane protease YdiL (CAAX protease family)